MEKDLSRVGLVRGQTGQVDGTGRQGRGLEKRREWEPCGKTLSDVTSPRTVYRTPMMLEVPGSKDTKAPAVSGSHAHNQCKLGGRVWLY